MEFTIEIDNIDDYNAKLGKLESSLMDWTAALAVVGAAFKAYYSSVPFASRGSVYGTPWADLNPSYKSWKAKNYPGKPVLVRTGELMKSFDFISSANAVRIFNRDSEVFEKHQKGIGVPQRIIMALNKERRDAAVDILRQDLMRKVNQA